MATETGKRKVESGKLSRFHFPLSAFHFLLLCVAGAGAGAGTGCSSQYSPRDDRGLQDLQATRYNVPPRQLLAAVKAAISAAPLSLAIEQEDGGALRTGWKEYRGDWHVARYWQERTRFRITVVPDWENPTTHSRLQVTEETEVRSNDRGTWHSEDDIRRPHRAIEVVQAVQRQLGKR